MNCPIISQEELDSRQLLMAKNFRIPSASRRWHEGTELLGYWAEGDSFVFRGDGHYFCLSRGFIEAIALGDLDFTEAYRD